MNDTKGEFMLFQPKKFNTLPETLQRHLKIKIKNCNVDFLGQQAIDFIQSIQA